MSRVSNMTPLTSYMAMHLLSERQLLFDPDLTSMAEIPRFPDTRKSISMRSRPPSEPTSLWKYLST